MSLFIALKVYGLGINCLENNVLIPFTTYDYKFFPMFYIRTFMTDYKCNRLLCFLVCGNELVNIMPCKTVTMFVTL